MQSKEVIQEAINNPQIAAGVSAAAAATGVATWQQWLPPAVGVLGSLLASVLTVVLIWSHITKTRAELRRSEAEERKHTEEAKLAKIKRTQVGDPKK